MNSPSPIHLDFEQRTLDNGLRVVLHPDRSLPLVALNLWYHVGSKNEKPGRTGFAHLFEHMLFQGSQNVGTNDHFRYVQQIGGVANGSTWYDRTNYYETLPSNYLDLGLWLESDRMGYLLSAMTSEKLETQRDVVMNERRQRVDNQPYGRAYERLWELLFPEDFPYHWPVIGYMEDIESASLDDVRSFFRTFYVPNNAVLTLAGDFDSDEAFDRVEAFFGPIAAGPDPPPVDSRLEKLEGELRDELEDEVQLPRVYIAYRAPRFGERGWTSADLLSTAWSSGKSSLLYQDLVYRRQIAQDVTSFVFPTEEAGVLCVVATARPGVEAAELEKALLEHVAAAREGEIGIEDLERARNRALTSFFGRIQRLDSRADLLSQYTTLFDDPGRLTSDVERYRSITSADLQAYAREFTVSEERAVLTVVPTRK